MLTLKEQYTKDIQPKLKKDLNKKNLFQVPMISKVVVSAGIGDWKEQKDTIEKIIAEITKLAGQKPKVNLSKQSVSAFKLREKQPVGITVTLRGNRMYDFLSRLINVALPRVRDFRGLSTNAFDKQGNYSIGIRDYSIFPEIKFEEIPVNFGLQVNIRIKTESSDDSRLLLSEMGFPFEKK